MSKFKFKKVKGQRVYKKWKEWEEGEYVIGKLIGTYIDKFKNTCYEVEVIESDVEEFEEGKVAGLNSCGSLNYKMEDVLIGSTVRVEYTGTTVLDKGDFEGTEAHTVDVSIDESTVPEEQEEQEEEDEGDDDL